jgi:hypothetical protein
MREYFHRLEFRYVFYTSPKEAHLMAYVHRTRFLLIIVISSRGTFDRMCIGQGSHTPYIFSTRLISPPLHAG